MIDTRQTKRLCRQVIAAGRTLRAVYCEVDDDRNPLVAGNQTPALQMFDGDRPLGVLFSLAARLAVATRIEKPEVANGQE